MARGAGGDIPGDGPGQGFTSSSTCTHVMGVSGAPTGTVGGAVNALSEHAEDPLSATVAKNRTGNARAGPKRVFGPK